MKNLVRSITALVALLGTLGFSMTASAQDAKAGERKAAMCIGCHGIPDYKASFPEVFRVPMIAGQNAKYIVASLQQYKKGDRKHPTMRGVSASLSDQDMADLAAFYSTEAKAEPVTAAPAQVPANVAELLKKGNCASCHGANFNTPIDPSYPKLAGQHGDYLYVALREYQVVDNNPRVGRNNAIMQGMARPFTPAETKVLANYFASLPGELKTITQSRFR